MIHCPQCRRAYKDETLRFCLEDGMLLVGGGETAPFDPQATMVLPEQQRREDNTEALALTSLPISQSLKEAENYFEQGITQSISGQHTSAAELYQQAIISLEDSLAELHFNLGQSLSEMGKFNEAVESFEQVTNLQPENAVAYNLLGRAYNELEAFEKAVEPLQQALKLRPDYADAFLALGYAYDELNQQSSALRAYEQAIRFKPDYVNAYFNLGVIHYNLQNFPAAIEAYKQAIRLKPDDAEAHCYMGMALLGLGDKAGAFEEYKILKNLDAPLANQFYALLYK